MNIDTKDEYNRLVESHKRFIATRSDLHLCVDIPIGEKARGWTVIKTDPITWEHKNPKGGKFICESDHVPPKIIFFDE